MPSNEHLNASSIAFVGAGNVATHLSRCIQKNGWEVKGVYSRTLASASLLAESLDCVATTHLSQLPEADIYLFSVTDDALPGVLQRFAELSREGIWIHTAGSIPLSVFDHLHVDCGVLYPLQSFTKAKHIDMGETPIFVEAATQRAKNVINELAQSISKNIFEVDSSVRGRIHVAAVFACNFVNCCYSYAAQIMESGNLPFNLLLPLIDETAEKVHSLEPIAAQTGPAARSDYALIERHLELLSDNKLLADTYRCMTNGIIQLRGKSYNL